MVDYFELPERVAEGGRQVLVTRLYSEQENPPLVSGRPQPAAFHRSVDLRSYAEERSGKNAVRYIAR